MAYGQRHLVRSNRFYKLLLAYITVFFLVPILALAQQETDETDEEPDIELLPVEFRDASLSCKLVPKGVSFVGKLEEKELVTIKPIKCEFVSSFEKGFAAKYEAESIEFHFELDFNEIRNKSTVGLLNKCSGLSLAWLSRITGPEDFEWEPKTSLIRDAVLTQIGSGEQTRMDNLIFHDQVLETKVADRKNKSVFDFIGGQSGLLNYQDIFYAKTQLLNLEADNEFNQELNRKIFSYESSNAGRIDKSEAIYQLALDVEVAIPRGVCVYEEISDAGKKAKKTIQLQFERMIITR